MNAKTTQTPYTCDRDASGWQLYGYDGYENQARAKRRGLSLSKRLTKLVRAALVELDANPRLSRVKLAERVRDEMYKLMNKYADDGASDTEPECVLVGELERAFGLEPYDLDR